MTEIAQPLTVRRTVALSRAVYDRRAIVEEMEAVSAKTQEDAEADNGGRQNPCYS